MKWVFAFISFFLIGQICFSQQNILEDLSNYQETTIDNGITILSVKSNIDTLVNMKFIFDFNPKIRKEFPGSVELISTYFNFNNNGYDQVSFTMVSDTNAIDSTFEFVSNKIVNPVFEDIRLKKAKKIELKKIKLSKNSYLEHIKTSRKFCFGKNNPYSVYPNLNDINLTNKNILQTTYKHMIKPTSCYIIAVGNTNHDSVVKYIKKHLGKWEEKNNNLSNTNYNFSPSNFSKINFINLKSATYISANYPVNNFYTDKDFFAKQVAAKIFEKKINDDFSIFGQKIDFYFIPRPYDAQFSVNANLKKKSIYNTTIQIISSVRDMLIYEPTINQSNIAKSEITKKFRKKIKNPYEIAHMAYLLHKYNLSDNFFRNYLKNINSVNGEKIKQAAKNIFLPENMNFYIQSDKAEIICELYSLAEFFKIEFFDKSFHKYKIIPKGFNSNYIINDYLKACNANSQIKNLTIKFNAKYNADTIYNVKGIIYKKQPNYYYYKTELIIEKDTFLQQLQIANKKIWLDSSAFDAVFYEDEEKFWAKIYQAYIFPELYYSKLKFKHEFICDTSLLKKNIFKIKVSTPYNVYFYDYYNLSTNKKTRTETIIEKNNKNDTLEVVEYYDYKKISKKSDLIMPYTIIKQINDFEFIMEIDTIDDRSRIKRKKFKLIKK